MDHSGSSHNHTVQFTSQNCTTFSQYVLLQNQHLESLHIYWIYLLVFLIVTEIKWTSVTCSISGWTECLEDLLFPFWDWPVGESPSLVAALSGEADGVLFLLWAAVGTSNMGFFGSSGAAALAYNKHKTLHQLFIHKNLIKKKNIVLVIAHLLLLLLLIFFICYFGNIGGGKLIGCLQSSNESLLSSCRLLARDWRETWKIKAKFSFWLALQFLNTTVWIYSFGQVQQHVLRRCYRDSLNTVHNKTPGLQNRKHNSNPILRS